MIRRFEVQLGGKVNKTFPATYVSNDDFVEFAQSKNHTDWFFRGRECGVDLETYGDKKFAGRTVPHSTKQNHSDLGLLPAVSLIRTCQIFNGEEVFIFDLMNTEKEFAFFGPFDLLFKDFYQRIIKGAARLYAHNALFETNHLQKLAYRWKIYQPLDIHCSMNAFRLIAHAVNFYDVPAQCKADLKTVAKEILDIDLEKDSQTSDWSASALTDVQLAYCARDAILPLLLHKTMEPHLEEMGLTTVHQLNRNAQELLAHMNVHGCCIDMEKHQEFIKKWSTEEAIHHKECVRLLNTNLLGIQREKFLSLLQMDLSAEFCALLPSFNDDERDTWAEQLFALSAEAENLKSQITGRKGTARTDKMELNKIIRNVKNLTVDHDSGPQLVQWLEANLSIAELEDWPRTEKRNALKVDASAFLEASHLEIVKPLVAYRKHSKLVSTYGDSMARFTVQHEDGTSRIHPNFTLCYTDTGRMSSYEPNVQNIPSRGPNKEIRKIFIPRPGDRTFITADFSQIELRIAAELSQDEEMLNAYLNGIDIHMLTASGILKKPIDQITKDERGYAKAPNFLLIYGGGAQTLMKGAKKDYGINMSLEEAQEIVLAFRQLYKGLRRWQETISRDGEQTLYSNTALGKLRRLDPQRYYNVAMNHPIQGGAAELMLLAGHLILDRFIDRKLDAYLVNIVHDEFDIDSHNNCASEVKEILRLSMEDSMSIVFPNATHRDLVGIESGPNWLEAK